MGDSSYLGRSLFFMMLSVGLYAFQDVLIKWLADEISLQQLIFCRSFFAFIPIFLVSGLEKESLWRALKHLHQPSKHLLRAFFSFLALICFVYAFTQMPLANAYTLTFAAPLFMTALSGPLLQEEVKIYRWVCVVTGFIGVVVVAQPGASGFQWASLVALLGGLTYALSLILVRDLSQRDSNLIIVFTFTCFSTFFSLPFALFSWAPLTAAQWEWLILIGILGGSAQFSMTQAFRLSAVSLIAPFDYAALLWAIAFDYLFFSHCPTLSTFLGAFLIIGAGLGVIYNDNTQRHATRNALT